MINYDIAIIGGGHAGVEAAYIASQFQNLKICIITMPEIGLASAPCNPAVGGVGKGQVVRELDALGGIIGRLADMSGIQFRTLNESKGFAVQSTRIQIDKELYSVNAEKIIGEINNIDVIREKVLDIIESDNGFQVKTKSSTWNTKKIIVTVGTFLQAKTHTGQTIASGGRNSTSETSNFSLFNSVKLNEKKFKTGTPSRLIRDSIRFEDMEEQPSDNEVENFHFSHEPLSRFLEQRSCYLTYTNEKTMKIIRDNKEKSPMFNGQIKAVGARYCPSIEDKAYRYMEKNIHHVFIEPEGINSEKMYPSGISSSLPAENQLEFIKTIKGLESVEIAEYGYAVEYSVLDTTQLNSSLEVNEIPGLYFAGQVNGTSGYEEAAAQGYIAGVNAALSAQGEKPLVLGRSTSYIGVMIQDLIGNLRDEPYRLFTARSENRLYNREDNSIIRMHPYRKQLGLNLKVDEYNDKFVQQYNLLINHLEKFYVAQNDEFLEQNNIKIGKNQSLATIIRQSTLDPIEVLKKYLDYVGIKLDIKLIRTLAISLKYSGYIERASKGNEKIDKLLNKKIEYEKLLKSENISYECKERIKKIRPETFEQLKNIEGIRQATLAVVASGSI